MAYNKTKTDSALGIEVFKHLYNNGIESPFHFEEIAEVEAKVKIEKIEKHMSEILKVLGFDLSDDSLMETPKRVAKMMVLDQFWGMDYRNFPKNTVIENKMSVDEMVTVGDISVNSLCEHHLLPILGKAYVSYIAGDKVIGLSKLARVVEYYCKRPQVQERLTSQIHQALCYLLGTDDVAVGINAVHLCMTTRGVEDPNAWTQTTKLSGAFKNDPQTRAEFLQLMKK